MWIHENLWKSMKIYEHQWKSMKINRKTIKINENLWKSITYMGSICFEKRRRVIFHILNTETPHISVLQREINCLNRENENLSFRETWTLTCKTQVKVTLFIKIWNDPTVITVTLPQDLSHKLMMKVWVLTKVLKVILSSLGLSVGSTIDNLT